MASQGTVIARVYTSDAFLPLANVPVTFTQLQPDGSRKLLAVRLTNSSGMTAPLPVETPDASESLSPGLMEKPYAVVNISVEYPGYGGVLAEGVQVFPGVETIQALQLGPLPSLPGEQDLSVLFPGSSQNL